MTKFAKAALCALTLGVAAPAVAEPIDIANITCEGFASLDEQTKGALIMWMDGYTGGINEDSTFDLERLGVNAADADAACSADPTRSLLEVMTEVTSG